MHPQIFVVVGLLSVTWLSNAGGVHEQADRYAGADRGEATNSGPVIWRQTRQAPSPRVNINPDIDLSNPEFIVDHHHGRRRVKKVLPGDGGEFAKEARRAGPRRKRFVLPLTIGMEALIALKFFLASLKGLSQPSKKVDIPPVAAAIPNEVIKTVGSGSGGGIEHNATFLELELFHIFMLRAMDTLCPDVLNSHVRLSETLPGVVSQIITRAQSTLSSGLPTNKHRFASFVRKLKQCEASAKSESGLKLASDNSKIKPFPSRQKRSAENKHDLSKILALEMLTFQLVKNKCDFDENDQVEGRRLATALFSILRNASTSAKTSPKKGLIREKDLVGGIEIIHKCLVKDHASMIDAIQRN